MYSHFAKRYAVTIKLELCLLIRLCCFLRDTKQFGVRSNKHCPSTVELFHFPFESGQFLF